MKKSKLLLTIIFMLTMASFSTIVRAQVSAGPSDPTTGPPATASAVAKVYCAGSTITLTGPLDPSISAPFTKYHWWKLDATTGLKVEETTQTGQTYTEVSTTTPGYYNYWLVTENANGCISPISSLLQVYVLPPLSVTITTPVASVCAGTTAPTLTANPTPATPYALNYQWTLAGADITGATSSTYTVPVDNTAETLTYAVKVSYALNPACSVTSANQNIVITPLPTQPTITAN